MEKLEQDFNTALKENRIKVYYQPVVRTLTYKLCGFEALARWIKEDGSVVSPDQFIPQLESLGIIHELDIYIVREVCKNLREQLNKGNEIVPISFNLSRLDFEYCDIFSEIENIVREYDVPRDLLHIEITETTVMHDPEKIGVAIDQIHTAGYKVWMDDFGSGYSSLNVLKDYEFDEIKIDMQFLSAFSERSKMIISSIVEMAKKIGTHTLAEGVETMEQVEFLRNLGCEKVQGFYYGRPLPYDESMMHCMDFGLYTEPRRDCMLYDKAGMVSVQTDRAFGILHKKDDDRQWIFINDIMLSVFEKLDIFSMAEFNRRLYDKSTLIYRVFGSAVDSIVESNTEKDFTYTDKGYYIKITGNVLSSKGEEALLGISLEAVEVNAKDKREALIDKYVRNAMLAFETLDLIDVQANTLEHVMIDGVFLGEKQRRVYNNSYRRIRFAKQNVYFDDREAFIAFSDPMTLKQRIAKEEQNMVSGRFRLKDPKTGNYNWKTFMIKPFSSDHDGVYIMMKKASFMQKGKVYTRGENIDYAKFGKYMISYREMWYGFMHNNPNIKWFCKDKDRRFIYASDSFLEYYGFDSMEDILGKTDEDMGWHVNNEPFKNDEEKVLKKGAQIVNARGYCIIKGVNHQIIATKMPLHYEGKIIGLIGYFMDMENSDDVEAGKFNFKFEDTVSGLLNFAGILASIADFEQERKTHNNDYGVAMIKIPEYKQLVEAYGESFGYRLIQIIAEILKETVGVNGVIGRYMDATFIIIHKYKSKGEIRGIVQSVTDKIHNLHEIDGYSCTLFADYSVVWGYEVKNVTQIPVLLNARLDESVSSEMSEGAFFGDRFVLEREKFDNMSDLCYMTDPDTYELLYMNYSARKSFGLAPDESLKGRKCYEVFRGRRTPCDNCVSKRIIRDKFYEWKFHNDIIGRTFFIKDTLIPWKGKTGRFIIATDVKTSYGSGSEIEAMEFARQFENDTLHLVMASYENLEDSIPMVLEKFGRTLKADCVYLYELSDDGMKYVSNYSWGSKENGAIKVSNRTIKTEVINRIYEEFDNPHQITVTNMHNTRNSSEFLKRIYEKLHGMGIRRLIGEKLVLGDKVIGYIEIDNPDKKMIESCKLVLDSVSQFIVTLIQNRNSHRELERRSKVDGLTGVMSRAGFNAYVSSLNEDNSKCLAFIYCDLNGLKKINDNLGHSQGDEYIRHVAFVLSSYFMKDSVFRMGGDEFLVVTHIPEENQVDEILKNLRAEFVEQKLSVAIGCKWVSKVEDDIEDILKEADQRMYQNKEYMHKHNL